MIKKTEQEIMKNWRITNKPVVSICCITYNHERYIEEALDSLLMQETNFIFEIIVRDDCSTDNTSAIIKEYVKKFPNIIRPIYETENQHSKGVSAFGTAYKNVKGKYIAILDGDDYWRDKLKLQKQVDFLEKNNEYVLSYHNSIIVDENNNLISKMKNLSPEDYTQEQMLCGEVFVLTNTVMFRKVENISGEQLDGVLNVDTVIWHLLGHHGKSKYQEEIEYAAYRKHTGGVWSSLGKLEQFEKAIKLKYTLRNMLPDNYNRLKKRIEKSMNRLALEWLYKSVKVLDIKAFRSITRLIVNNDNLSIFKMLLSLPGFFLQKIKHQYLKLTTKKI